MARQWQRRMARAVAVAGIAAAVGLSAAPARANSTYPVNTTLNLPADVKDNPCNGEPVALSGSIHILTWVDPAPGGAYYVRSEVQEQEKGTGLFSGDSYTSTQMDDTRSWEALPPFPTTEDERYALTLASSGPDDNYLLRYTIHTTISLFGLPVVTADNFEGDCVG